MFSKLWVAQDLFAELEAISVLLVFVASLQQKTEKTLHQAFEANRLPFYRCTNPQRARLKCEKKTLIIAEWQHCVPVTSRNNWSFLLRASKTSHTPNIAGPVSMRLWHRRNRTWDKSLDDGRAMDKMKSDKRPDGCDWLRHQESRAPPHPSRNHANSHKKMHLGPWLTVGKNTLPIPKSSGY